MSSYRSRLARGIVGSSPLDCRSWQPARRPSLLPQTMPVAFIPRKFLNSQTLAIGHQIRHRCARFMTVNLAVPGDLSLTPQVLGDRIPGV